MSFRNEAGKGQRPDCIIHLPEGRHLVIDAKVSLTAYERYFQATDEKERKRHLQEHVQSVRQHLRELGRKDYQQLYQIDTPDYLLMFVPIDTAFNLAVQQENNLYLEALDKNIVMVTTATLLATLRTVSYLWRQDKQQRNVQEIARQSGMLYDKFVGFLEDLKLVGARLEQAREAWAAASNKLSDSPKFGDTLIGRAERIRMLGARTAKRLPPELLSGDLSETDAGDQPA
jgi:DNA recombination protein RmuC